MKVKVTEACRGAKDGERKVSNFYPGDIVEGSLAKSFIEMGVAKAMKETPQNKMMEGARFPKGVDDNSGKRAKPNKKGPSKGKK